MTCLRFHNIPLNHDVREGTQELDAIQQLKANAAFAEAVSSGIGGSDIVSVTKHVTRHFQLQDVSLTAHFSLRSSHHPLRICSYLLN